MNLNLQKSAEINVRAFHKVKQLLRVGMSELEIARLAAKVLRSAGAEKLAFPVIASLGANAAVPHHKPIATRRARPGDLLMLDMGGVYHGMRSDLTRTLFFGSPRADYRRWYNAVLAAQKRAYRGVRAGRTGVAVDALARKYLRARGFERHLRHGLGHGIGRAIHQRPWLSPQKGRHILKSGDVITLEPAIYFPGRGGVRIEDCCEVLDTGARWLVPQQRHIATMIIKI